MNGPLLAGLGLLIFGATRKMSPEEMRRREEAQDFRRREFRSKIRRGGKVRKADPGKQASRNHVHIFTIAGQEIVTKKTFQDEGRPDKHSHLLEFPVSVITGRGRTTKRLRINLKLATTFDSFAEGHTHKATVRGKVHRSGGPLPPGTRSAVKIKPIR